MEQQEINKAVAQGLNELFVWFVGLQPNTRTKLPSVNIKQEEAIGVVKHINFIASIVGYQNRLQTNEDGSVTVLLEELPLPKSTDEALEEIVELSKDIGQEL
jgi:5,10-methylene-tetrahydrofolate dehydrogenase/methenyl tetrahydrofolate cyclohydrolase